MIERKHERVPMAPEFRQALRDPLERSDRTELLDVLAGHWLAWSADDVRWATLLQLVESPDGLPLTGDGLSRTLDS